MEPAKRIDTYLRGTVNKKILIVEDEEDIIELLSAIFDSLEDYGVLHARDGDAALRITRTDNPDIILLDIQLPKFDGYKVCESIKSDPAMSHTKVLTLSGKAQNLDRLKAHKVGADGYIVKPFTSVELIEKVAELLRRN